MHFLKIKKQKMFLQPSTGLDFLFWESEKVEVILILLSVLGYVYFTENHFRKNVFRKMTYRKIFYGKKKRKKKLVKCFTFFKSVRHFTKKWLDFQLTRKIFFVDHLFFAKQTPENIENIFL